MCLAVPGRIVRIAEGAALRSGTVSFGGAETEVCLAYVPDAVVGDYVIVHAGFALSALDESEAARLLDYLEEIEDAAEASE
jgi:hydrogenase expression/formation protein HypC